MRAIKISCTTRTISIVEIHSYRNICNELNHSCEYFGCPMVFETNDVMYADYYAGLSEFSGGFLLDGWSHPVLGDAIIVGTDEYGNLSDVVITKNEIDNQISFISKDLAKKWFYYESDLTNKLLISKNQFMKQKNSKKTNTFDHKNILVLSAMVNYWEQNGRFNLPLYTEVLMAKLKRANN